MLYVVVVNFLNENCKILMIYVLFLFILFSGECLYFIVLFENFIICDLF